MARSRSSSSASFIKFISERVPSSFFKDNASSRTLPVIVNPGPSTPSSSSQSNHHHQHNDDEEIALPAISHFTWDAVVEHTSSEYTAVVDAVNNIVGRYKTDLTEELTAATATQNEITATMAQADTLAADTVKQTRTFLTDASAQLSKLELSGVAKLAQLAEQTYDTMTSIASLLHDIEALLPEAERLEPQTSVHKNHYPRLHAILHDKSEVTTLYSQPPKIRQPQPRRAVSMSALNHQAIISDRKSKNRSVSSRTMDGGGGDATTAGISAPFMRFDSKPVPPRLSSFTTTVPAEQFVAETVLSTSLEDTDPARAKLQSLMRSHTIALSETTSTRSFRSS